MIPLLSSAPDLLCINKLFLRACERIITEVTNKAPVIAAQKLGEKLKELEDTLAKLNKSENRMKKRETKVLFKEAVVSKLYNTDEIDMRLFKADEGLWIKKLYEYDDTVQFQLVAFHVRKAIMKAVLKDNMRKIFYSIFNIKK